MTAVPHTSSPALLDVRGLRVTYGGVVAVADVDLADPPRAGLRPDRPQRGGQDVDDRRAHGLSPAVGRGSVVFDGRDITRLQAAPACARCGSARTFQSVELFDDLTVDENLLVASERAGIRHALRDLFLPARPPDRTRRRLGDLGLRAWSRSSTATRGRSPTASASSSASAGRSRSSRASCCSTSRPPASTPTRASSSAARLRSLPARARRHRAARRPRHGPRPRRV